MISTDTNFWEDLLLFIEEGKVVPIVGRDLLVVETDKGLRPFHSLVAERLAAELNISIDDLPADFDTNDVICAYKNFDGDAHRIYPKVVRILKALTVPVPESLRLLVAIPKFRLFVSTTFDSLLEEALKAVRRHEPAVASYLPTTDILDFNKADLGKEGSLVFHILGRASGSTAFALTEGQMLEQIHNLMSKEGRPRELIARLRESHLLILGVSFPDWLARFLLRLSREQPLWANREAMEIIADKKCAQPEFAQFLQRFSPKQSCLAGGSPIDFVRELHRRWFERHPAQPASGNSITPATGKPPEMSGGSVFISYASEDRDAVFRLYEVLTSAGIEVWIDRRINPGDDFSDVIKRNIRECCAFMPVLSRHTQPDDDRWFRIEWQYAKHEVAPSYYGTDLPFLFPVVVDSTPNNELIEFRRGTFDRSASRAFGGNPPPELIEQLDRAQKAWRKRKQLTHA